jgi:hypothetical protein
MLPSHRPGRRTGRQYARHRRNGPAARDDAGPARGWEAQAAEDGLQRGSAYWDAGWAWIAEHRVRPQEGPTAQGGGVTVP